MAGIGHALGQYGRRLLATEPAALAEAARLVLGALVLLGWITLDSTAINAVVTAVGAVASIVLTGAVRSRVDSPATSFARRRAWVAGGSFEDD